MWKHKPTSALTIIGTPYEMPTVQNHGTRDLGIILAGAASAVLIRRDGTRFLHRAESAAGGP
jgi:hypothetical protein